jgi:hypothetical protein
VLAQADPSEVRAFVAIQVLGLCAALEAEVMDPTTAYRWLFRPGMREQLEGLGACPGCLGLVEVGQKLTTGCTTVSAQAIAELRARALDILRVIDAHHHA